MPEWPLQGLWRGKSRMPRTMDWRSQNAGDALKELDRAGLAWEFLRRNPEYREDYRRALERIAIRRHHRGSRHDGNLPSLGVILSSAIPTGQQTSTLRSGGPNSCRRPSSLSLRLTAIPRLENLPASISARRGRAPSRRRRPYRRRGRVGRPPPVASRRSSRSKGRSAAAAGR